MPAPGDLSVRVGAYVGRRGAGSTVTLAGREGDMIHVDWDDLQLTDDERARAEQRIERMAVGPRDVFTVRRVVHGYQAIFSKSVRGCGTELRFHGSNLMRVLDRASELSSVVAREGPQAAPHAPSLALEQPAGGELASGHQQIRVGRSVARSR